VTLVCEPRYVISGAICKRGD